jgi:dihydroorotate dehydrogenase
LAERLGALGDLGYPLGISIGKSKVTPLEDAVEDYVTSFRRLYRFGDYFAVNVSSPNTPGLRSLQDSGHLRELLTALHTEATSLSSSAPAPSSGTSGLPAATGGSSSTSSASAASTPSATSTPSASSASSTSSASSNSSASLTSSSPAPKPILVKIAPDLTESAIDELLGVCTDVGVAGIIATNTTVGRSGLASSDLALAAEAGGLSGRPLTEISAKTVAHIHAETQGALPIIGVGGILDPSDAARLFDAGASLVQLYTGLIYRGPTLVRRTNRLLAQRL